MSAKIFINYRRDDSAPYAVSIAQYLENAFGKDSVFIDVDWLRPGQSFPDVLNERLRECEVMLVVIGPNWLDAADGATRRRLDNPNDWVRLEIIAALAQGLHVIPVLVGGESFPDVTDLPVELRPLGDRHHVALTTNGFRYEMAGLVKDIAPLITRGQAPARSRWSMSNRSIMSIALRLSIVVGILAGAWSYFQGYARYNEAREESWRISRALFCAKLRSEETLREHINEFGLIDISKVGCSEKTPFWARMDEIRGATLDHNAIPHRLSSYVNLEIIMMQAFAAMVVVTGLGFLLVIARLVALWVIGIKRPVG